MNNWQETAFDGLQPLKEIIHDEVISGNVIHADETPVKVINQNPEEIRKELGLKETEELKDREKCYIWVLIVGKKIILSLNIISDGHEARIMLTRLLKV